MNKALLCLLTILLLSGTAVAQVWESVGDPLGISEAGVGRLSLVNDFQDHLVVGYYDESVDAGSVQKFDGTNWTYLGDGPGMTPSSAAYLSLSIDNQDAPFFTYQIPYPGSGLAVRKFVNNQWVDLPNATNGSVNFQASSFSADNTLYIVTGENSGTVRRFVNGIWEQVGTSNFFDDIPYYLDMDIANNGKIFISFNSNGYVHVLENNIDASSSDAWLPVGGVTNVAPAPSTENYNSALAVDGNNNLYLAYASSYAEGQKLNVKKYDGTEWSQLGNEQFSSNAIQHVSIGIGADNIIYVAASNYADTDYLRNYVMYYNNASDLWVQAGTGWASMGEAVYNSLEVDSNGNLFLAFSDSDLNKLSVKKLNLDIIATESVEISTEGGGAAEITVDDGTLQLSASVFPEDALQDVIWAMDSGETFATVDETGLVTAIASNAIIRVRAFSVQNESIFDTFDIAISNQNSDVEAEEIVVSTEDNVFSDILSIGEHLQLVSSISPAEADQYVEWTVEEGSNVVSINSDGLVTADSEGFAIVRATCATNANLFDEIRINVWENGCSQGIESMFFGSGNIISNNGFGADDFIVEDGMRFEAGTVRLNILCNPNVVVNSVDLHFLKTDVDRPGEEIIAINNITPTYQNFIHDWDYVSQYEIELDLEESIVFEQGTYWLMPVVTASNGSNVYWDNTTNGDIGYSCYNDLSDGHGWRITLFGGFDNAFEITGNCTPMPIVVSAINGEDNEMFVGDELQLQALVNETGISQDVYWTLESGSEFASVDENGLVNGIDIGLAIVRATSIDNASVLGEIEITVIDPNTCGASAASSGLEDGYGFGSTRLAVDLIVEENHTFTINSIEPTVLDLATEFSVIIYKDVNGLPGAGITASSTGFITHNTTTGFSFGYYFHRYLVELSTPITLEEGTYWMEILTNAAGWESTSLNIIGNSGVFNNSDTGGEWVYSSDGSELVYNINGICELVTSISNNEDSKDIDIKIYPNPAGDYLSIKRNNLNEESTEIFIYDSFGRMVKNSTFVGETNLNISTLSSGVYYMKFCNNKNSIVHKVVVN